MMGITFLIEIGLEKLSLYALFVHNYLYINTKGYRIHTNNKMLMISDIWIYRYLNVHICTHL